MMDNMISSLGGIHRTGQAAALESLPSIVAPSGSAAGEPAAPFGSPAEESKDCAWARGGDFKIGPANMDLLVQ